MCYTNFREEVVIPALADKQHIQAGNHLYIDPSLPSRILPRGYSGQVGTGRWDDILAENPIKISVRVKTNCTQALVEKIADDQFLVQVHARPEKGKANAEVIERLADYLNTPKSNLTIISGYKFPEKIIEVRK